MATTGYVYAIVGGDGMGVLFHAIRSLVCMDATSMGVCVPTGNMGKTVL